MATLEDVKNIIVEQGEEIEKFKKTHELRYDNIEKELRYLKNWQLEETTPGGSKFGSHDLTPAPVTEEDRAAFKIKLANGDLLPTIGKSALVADFFPKDNEDNFSIGSHVKSIMLGSTKAVSSAALVPVSVSSNVIDMVRAQTTVIQAGAKTIVIDGNVNLAKITGDATVYQHTEGADDIEESDITLANVPLRPKALVAVVPLSMEVVADSPNLDAVLNQSLAAAFASKIDSLALATILADVNIPTSVAGKDPAVWGKCLETLGELMALNQTIPTSMITNTADFVARASQLASTSGVWLGSPPALSNMIEYPTTNITAGTAIYGGFGLGMAIAMRQELRIEVIRFHKPTSATHMLVAHMRAEGVILQPKRLFIQKKVVA